MLLNPLSPTAADVSKVQSHHYSKLKTNKQFREIVDLQFLQVVSQRNQSEMSKEDFSSTSEKMLLCPSTASLLSKGHCV